jgi:hypothetical protein
MGKVNGVTVTTVYSVMTPLEQIEDKTDWRDHILRQASFAASALNTDLETSLSIVKHFEKHKAWEYIGVTRESFFRFQVISIPKTSRKSWKATRY